MQAQPWNKILLSDEQIQIMYREWGVFYTLKQKLDLAANYYDISLEYGTDPKALYNRSRCKRNIAQTVKALKDAQTSLDRDPYRQPYNLEVCDGWYQLNQFEKAKSEVFNNSLKFQGRKLEAFYERHEVLDIDFKATLGRTLGLFILEHEKYIILAQQKMVKERNIDRRPLWKILREQEKCDVLSILEKEEELVCPREIARRRRAFNVFNQIYMQRSWVDVIFLQQLTKNPNLLLPESQWSRPLLEHLTSSKYDVTMRFLRMLHSRSPLYNEKVRRCPSRTQALKRTHDYLMRVQYQIHRNMLAILRKIRLLRKARQLDKLTTYVEEIMGDYVVLKTHRVMPWKFEFINEVYNLLALSYIDLYINIPKDIADYKSSDRLRMLLKVPTEKDKENKAYVFGDKTQEQDDEVEKSHHKKFLIRMEKRIFFTKYPIEKSYAWHAIASAHLKISRFDECCIAARKCIEEAKKCNSLVWMLIGYIMTCKSHSVLRKIEKIQESLLEATVVANQLENAKILGFIALLRNANDQDTFEKRLEEQRKNKMVTKSNMSKQSITSQS